MKKKKKKKKKNDRMPWARRFFSCCQPWGEYFFLYRCLPWGITFLSDNFHLPWPHTHNIYCLVPYIFFFKLLFFAHPLRITLNKLRCRGIKRYRNGIKAKKQVLQPQRGDTLRFIGVRKGIILSQSRNTEGGLIPRYWNTFLRRWDLKRPQCR